MSESNNKDVLVYVNIAKLEPHPHNPRGPVNAESVQELADSIKEKGVLEPLLVVPGDRDKGRNRMITSHRIVAGHRRYAAARIAGLEQVPVIVRIYSPAEQEEIMLAENLQRADLTPLQEARAYKRLVAQGYEQAEIARKLGVGTSRISNNLRILNLGEPVQQMFNSFEMPVTAVAALLKVTNLDRQERLAVMIASRRISVPKLKQMAEELAETEQTDASVEKARRSETKKRALPARVVYTRADAVADLELRNGSALTFTDVRVALERVCDQCGMKNMPDICGGCPLPQFLSNLMKGDGNASQG